MISKLGDAMLAGGTSFRFFVFFFFGGLFPALYKYNTSERCSLICCMGWAMV